MNTELDRINIICENYKKEYANIRQHRSQLEANLEDKE